MPLALVTWSARGSAIFIVKQKSIRVIHYDNLSTV